MTTNVRITTSEAIVRYLVAQRIVVDGEEVPLFPGVIGIFGHGNVTSLGHSLEMHRDEIPVWRGQNEQGMGLAAAAFAKAVRRQQVMVATSSVGPGATNMITAAGVAMANRLPVLFISGDTFVSRLPDPVLQQVEHFGSPSTTVNDGFRPVVRFWDRLMHPAQVLSSLPQAVSTLLDPADCGPAFLGLPQDVAAEAYDYPEEFFATQVHEIARPRPDTGRCARAADAIRGAKRPVIIAGGGVHYSRAEDELAAFAEEFGIPVVETVAGKSCLLADHPRYAGPVGVTGAGATNVVVPEADLVIAIGTRLEDFTTGSWTLFDPSASFVGINAARFDAIKHRSIPVVGDARESLADLTDTLRGWTADEEWTFRGMEMRIELQTFVDGRTADDGVWPPSYAQLVGLVHESATPDDYVMTAAGGLPGELNINWMSKADRVVRLRLRVLVHGLRDRRRVGRGLRPADRAGVLHGRRRLVPDDELRDLRVGPLGEEVHPRRLRQRGLRRHRAAPGRPGRRVVQQHAQGLHRHGRRRARRLRRARASRWAP